MKPRLAFNCPEKWENMKLGLVSRHCESCDKDVHDFTAMTKEEILRFLLTNRSKQVCGRILKSQLDYHHDEVLVTIQSCLNQNKNTNLAFYLLTLGTLTLVSCSDQSAYRQELLRQDSITNLVDAHGQQELAQIQNENSSLNSSPPHFATLGFLTTVPPEGHFDFEKFNGARYFAEVMPEFAGGYEHLVQFLTENLKCPEWERKHKIEGTVYVSFTIDKGGKVLDPKVLKSVEEAKNFDREVLRIIEVMPDWIPGEERGEKVAVRFTLPIKFKL